MKPRRRIVWIGGLAAVAGIAALAVHRLSTPTCGGYFIWRCPTKPAVQDLVGRWEGHACFSRWSDRRKYRDLKPIVELRDDRAFVMYDLPFGPRDGWQHMVLRTASGTWNLEDWGQGWQVMFEFATTAQANALGDPPGFFIMDDGPPYSLLHFFGDPDLDQRVRYQRTGPCSETRPS